MPSPSKTSMNTAPTQIQKPAAPAIAVSWFQQFSKQQQQFLRDMHKIAGYSRVPTTQSPALQKSLAQLAQSSTANQKAFLNNLAQQTKVINNWGAVQPFDTLARAIADFEQVTGNLMGYTGKGPQETFSEENILAGMGKGMGPSLKPGPTPGQMVPARSLDFTETFKSLDNVDNAFTKTMGGLWGGVSGIWQGTIGKVFSGISSSISPILGKVPAFGKLVKNMGGMFGNISGASGGMGIALSLFMMIAQAGGLFQAFSDILGVIFTVLGTSLMPIIQMLYDSFLSPAMIAILEQLAGVMGQLFLAFSPVIPIFASILEMALSLLIPILQLITPLLQLFLLPLQLLAPLLQLLTPGIEALSYVISGIIKPIQTVVDLIINGKYGLVWAFGYILKFFQGLIGGIFKLLNVAIEAINWVIPGKKDDMALLTIPKFAEGGVVMGPTLAMVGEAGPEAIVPLNQMGSGSGGITVVVNGSITSRQMRELDEKLWIAQSRERMW